MTRSVLLMAVLLTGGGCGRPARGPEPVEATGLHHVYRLTPGLYSGSGPEGDAGFRSLAGLGVRTVLSVDGGRPAVEQARNHGLRYVHFPVGYDGVPRARALEIARAVRDLPGPVYVHCHHGKHRGPAAAAAAALCLGAFDRRQAEAWLRTAGTDPRYVGLVGVPRMELPTAGEIDAAPADFPETNTVSDVARLMVEIDGRLDHLRLIRRAGWKTPATHPDLSPWHEAVLLAEHYREAARASSSGLRTELQDAEKGAVALEAALRAGKPDAIESAFRAVQQACAGCHGRHRDAGAAPTPRSPQSGLGDRKRGDS